jgi:hypothetical protein
MHGYLFILDISKVIIYNHLRLKQELITLTNILSIQMNLYRLYVWLINCMIKTGISLWNNFKKILNINGGAI